jgi:hypothetical protein
MKITNRLTLSIYCFLFVFAGVIGAYGGLSELLLIAHAQSNDTVEQTETLIYDYPNLGFTLEYPSNWSKQESLSFISPPTSPPTSQSSSSPLAENASNDTISATNLTTESIAVTTEVLVSNITLKEYSESVIGFLESQFPDFTLLNSFKTTLSGYPAHQIEYTFALEGSELKNLQRWTIVDNIVYAVTYGRTTDEFDSSLSVFDNLIESFQVTETQ